MRERYSIPFVKMQGVGNDFVLVDERTSDSGPMDWPSVASAMCDRRFGIGADGLLIVAAARSEQADVRMRMFNPDGTEDFCGNGLRCVARFAAPDSGGVLQIETLAGIREASVHRDPEGSATVTVNMGRPSFNPREFGVQLADAGPYLLEVGGQALQATTISVGTVHTVIFVDALPADPEFSRLSRLIERHPAFPERTSIMWTRVESRSRLSLRIWERGAGETWGCGTGACAAAIAAIREGMVDSPTVVESKGGELQIAWTGDGDIQMTGPAEYAFEGIYTVPR